MSDLKVICLSCKEDYKLKSNTIKMGKFWCEVYNNNNGYDLCKWCLFGLSERSNNVSM